MITMNTLDRLISRLCHISLWISTTIIFFILVSNTLLRYLTGSSLQWANEVPELLFPWLVMSGVVLAAVHSAHITTSFLRDMLPPRWQRSLTILVWCAVAGLYATLAIATLRLIPIVHDEKSPILQISGSVTYSCMLIGMVLLSLLALQSAWQAWQSPPPDKNSMSAPPTAHW